MDVHPTPTNNQLPHAPRLDIQTQGAPSATPRSRSTASSTSTSSTAETTDPEVQGTLQEDDIYEGRTYKDANYNKSYLTTHRKNFFWERWHGRFYTHIKDQWWGLWHNGYDGTVTWYTYDTIQAKCRA